MFLMFIGRKSYWTGYSALTFTCYIGSNFWTKKSCLLEGWFHNYSPICPPTENAGSLDPTWDPSFYLCLLQRFVLWCRKWSWGRLLCKVILSKSSWNMNYI